MNTLIITGGYGFIGSNFIRLLLTNNAEDLQKPQFDRLINLDAVTYAASQDNLSDFDSDERLVHVEGSICDADLLSELFQKYQPIGIINFAAESHVDRSIDSPEPFIQTNVVGTQRLLDATRRYLRSASSVVKERFRFLHVSTDEVFGSLGPEDDPFCESTPFAPNSPYSASKAGSDFLVRASYHTHNLPVLTTNCSNNYGPYQFPEKLIPLMILNALEGRPLPVYGDGKNIRDWLYVIDHCKGILAVLQRGRVGETYCIGGRSERQNIDIVNTICSLLDELAPKPAGLDSFSDLITFVKDRPGHDRRYAINSSKIESEVGWRPEESFDTGVRKTVLWYLENQDWCQRIAQRKYNRQRLGNL